MPKNKETIALDYISLHGLARPKDLEAYGIKREHLQRLSKKGLIEKVTRGVYRKTNAQVSAQCGMAEVSKRVPGCIICLFSALQFHEIGTELPGKVWIAVRRGAWHPRINYPPIETVSFSDALINNGVAEYKIDGVLVKITTVARTVADCFKFRNKIGLDVALESLKDVLTKKRCTIMELSEAAEQCRVSKIIRPYIEALI